MITISTHNGTSLSTKHNRRTPSYVRTQTHINPNGVHESWIDEGLKSAYKRIFDSALQEYNAKQKRADRQIKDYYDKVKTDKRLNLAYEMICTVGSRDNRPDDDVCKMILREYVDGWKERNPNLELVGAYYHADEQGSPHIHLDYIPVVRDCKRGLRVQNSLTKALKEQGYESEGARQTAQMKWIKGENRVLEAICNQHGLEVEHPMSDKADVKHLDTEIYKRTETLKMAQNEIKANESTLKEQNEQIERLMAQNDYLNKVINLNQEREKFEKDKQEVYNKGVMDTQDYFEKFMNVFRQVLEMSKEEFNKAISMVIDKMSDEHNSERDR